MVRYSRLFNVFEMFSSKIRDSHIFIHCGIKVAEGFPMINNLAGATCITINYSIAKNEKSVLCKGLNVAVPPKTIECSEFLLLFEMLFRKITSFDIGNYNKECDKSRLRHSTYSSFKQVSKISEKNLPRKEVNPLNN